MPVQRERDNQGRARNGRPRDALGRPLPRGAEGVPRVPDELVLPPLPSLVEAQRLLDAGMPFHAHEVLEATWKAAPPHERELWQGLAQLAVGYTHLLRGNPAGAGTLLERARRRVALYGDDAPPYGIDVPGLLLWVDDVLHTLNITGAATAEPPHLQRQASSGSTTTATSDPGVDPHGGAGWSGT